MLKIILTNTAAKHFAKELKNNGIACQFQVKPTFLYLEATPKLDMAIRMVKERFGQAAIIVKDIK